MARRTVPTALATVWLAVAVIAGAEALDEGSAAGAARADVPASGDTPATAGTVDIAFAGDITPGSRYGLPPDRAVPMFDGVRDAVSAADLAIGNLEGTLSSGGASKCGTDGGACFSFQAPPENARGLADAGFDVMSLANNHALDFGADGQAQTVAALEAEGVLTTGMPGQIATVERRGVSIALVGFAPYPWSNDVHDLEAAGDLVRAAAREADLTVVVAHLGAEGTGAANVPIGPEVAFGEPRGDTRAFAHAVVDAGADLVLASGPHVLRGIELYDGTLIAYSLGNFAGWENFSRAGALGESALLTVTLTPDGHLRGGRLLPLTLEGPGIPVPDETGAAVTTVAELGHADFGETALRPLPDGSF